MNDDLLLKIKNMSQEELMNYHSAGKFISRILDLLGIAVCLAVIFWASTIAVVAGGGLLFVLGKLASSMDYTIVYIENCLARLDK